MAIKQKTIIKRWFIKVDIFYSNIYFCWEKSFSILKFSSSKFNDCIMTIGLSIFIWMTSQKIQWVRIWSIFKPNSTSPSCITTLSLLINYPPDSSYFPSSILPFSHYYKFYTHFFFIIFLHLKKFLNLYYTFSILTNEFYHFCTN